MGYLHPDDPPFHFLEYLKLSLLWMIKSIYILDSYDSLSNGMRFDCSGS